MYRKKVMYLANMKVMRDDVKKRRNSTYDEGGSLKVVCVCIEVRKAIKGRE